MSRSKLSSYTARSKSTTTCSSVLQPILNSVSLSNRMTTKNESSPFPKKKRVDRCRRCKNCLKVNCGICRACLNMRKFGGTGSLKLACDSRPKCLNIVVPTVEKRQKKEGKRNYVKKQFGMEEGKRKYVKKKDRNENLIEVEEKAKVNNCNNYKSNHDIEVIMPYEPRVFPMTDEDYNRMMAEERANDDNYKSNIGIEIPTRSWRVNELGPRKKCEDLDFEDTNDDVYKLRHARAANGLGTLEKPPSGKDYTFRIIEQENPMVPPLPVADHNGEKNTVSAATSRNSVVEYSCPWFRAPEIPFVAPHLEIRLPDFANFEDDPNLHALLRSSRIPQEDKGDPGWKDGATRITRQSTKSPMMIRSTT